MSRDCEIPYSRMKMKVPRMLPCEHRPIAIPAPMTRRQLKKMESNIPAVGPIREALMASMVSPGTLPSWQSFSNA